MFTLILGIVGLLIDVILIICLCVFLISLPFILVFWIANRISRIGHKNENR